VPNVFGLQTNLSRWPSFAARNQVLGGGKSRRLVNPNPHRLIVGRLEGLGNRDACRIATPFP
jgi:hypothetical protein